MATWDEIVSHSMSVVKQARGPYAIPLAELEAAMPKDVRQAAGSLIEAFNHFLLPHGLRADAEGNRAVITPRPTVNE